MSKGQERKIPNVIVVSALKGGAAEGRAEVKRDRNTAGQILRLLTGTESSF